MSIFSWQQPREKFQELYDTEKLLLKKPLYKSIGSKVVITSVEDAINHSESYIIENNVAIKFPYGQFESSAIAATDDEEVKIIYHYSDKQKEYRVEAREICQGHLDSIVAQYPNLKEYEEFNTLQDIITRHLYLYPPLLSHLVNNLIGAIKKSDNGCSVALSEFKDKINDDKVLSNIQDNHMALAKEMGNVYRDFQKKRTAQKAQKSETTVASANTYSFHSRPTQMAIDENYIKMELKRP